MRPRVRTTAYALRCFHELGLSTAFAFSETSKSGRADIHLAYWF